MLKTLKVYVFNSDFDFDHEAPVDDPEILKQGIDVTPSFSPDNTHFDTENDEWYDHGELLVQIESTIEELKHIYGTVSDANDQSKSLKDHAEILYLYTFILNKYLSVDKSYALIVYK